jgi:hypothetical protein
MLSNQIVTAIGPLYLPLEGEDATALATAVACAASLHSPPGEGLGMGS